MSAPIRSRPCCTCRLPCSRIAQSQTFGRITSDEADPHLLRDPHAISGNLSVTMCYHVLENTANRTCQAHTPSAMAGR